MPEDLIELRGLRLAGIVGVLPHEQAQPQPLEVDVDLGVDLRPAGDTDELDDTAVTSARDATAARRNDTRSPRFDPIPRSARVTAPSG